MSNDTSVTNAVAQRLSIRRGVSLAARHGITVTCSGLSAHPPSPSPFFLPFPFSRITPDAIFSSSPIYVELFLLFLSFFSLSFRSRGGTLFATCSRRAGNF